MLFKKPEKDQPWLQVKQRLKELVIAPSCQMAEIPEGALPGGVGEGLVI